MTRPGHAKNELAQALCALQLYCSSRFFRATYLPTLTRTPLKLRFT
jgi:hypothetical protein